MKTAIDLGLSDPPELTEKALEEARKRFPEPIELSDEELEEMQEELKGTFRRKKIRTIINKPCLRIPIVMRYGVMS